MAKKNEIWIRRVENTARKAHIAVYHLPICFPCTTVCQIWHKISKKLNVNSNLSRSWNTKIALSKIQFVSLVKCQHIGKCKFNITLKMHFNLIDNIFKNTLTKKKKLKKKTSLVLGFEPTTSRTITKSTVRWATALLGIQYFRLSVVYLKSWNVWATKQTSNRKYILFKTNARNC